MSNVKPLEINEDVSTVLDDNLALSGVVDKDGEAYLCAKASAADGDHGDFMPCHAEAVKRCSLDNTSANSA